jgi:hypothetical protein
MALGPHQGHCSNRCNGLVEIANGNVTPGAEYYLPLPDPAPEGAEWIEAYRRWGP